MFIRYGYGYGFPLWGAIIGLILLALLVGAIIWLIVAVSRPGRPARMMRWQGGPYGPHLRTPALDELDLAYARGQMTRDEYLRRRADLTGWGPPGGPPGFAGPGPQAPGGDPGAPTSS
jgi:hypothetical protein